MKLKTTVATCEITNKSLLDEIGLKWANEEEEEKKNHSTLTHTHTINYHLFVGKIFVQREIYAEEKKWKKN